MTLREYYDTITDTEERRQHLDSICKQAARGFLLSALAGADTPAEMVEKVLRTFRSDCNDLSFFDAASISKLIPDSALKQRGIIVEDDEA